MGRGFGNLGNATEVLDESFYQFSRLPLSLNVLVKCENACYVEALFDDTKCVRVHLKTIYGIHLWRLDALKSSREQIVWVPFLPLCRDHYRYRSQKVFGWKVYSFQDFQGMDMEASFGHMQAMEFIWPAAARFQCCMAARQIAGFGQPSRVVTVCRCAHCASSPHSSVATMMDRDCTKVWLPTLRSFSLGGFGVWTFWLKT